VKSTAAILATAMFVGDCTTASPSLAGTAAVVQTISRIVNVCPLTVLYNGGRQRLYLADDDDAINWLDRMAMKALAR